jgi:hypothetical protein
MSSFGIIFHHHAWQNRTPYLCDRAILLLRDLLDWLIVYSRMCLDWM